MTANTRDIKFRAWDEVGKQWIYLSLADLRTNQLERQGFNNLRVINWCECTGLKDRNGVEIYEGDITKFTTSYGKDVLRLCKWDDDRPGFIWDEIGFNAKSFRLNQPFHDSVGAQIIGNIYENPELLK